MALTYASPGVYVEEVDRGTKPIQAAGTSMAAFVGITAEASTKALNAATGKRTAVESRINKPTLVTSWTQYTDSFGEFVSGAFLPDAVYGYFANGGGPCYITSLRALNEGTATSKSAEVAVPARNKGGSFKVTAKNAGPGANGLQVTVTATGEEHFALTVGGETKAGLTMKKGEGFVGDAHFEVVTISEVGAAVAFPIDGTYTLGGGGVQPLTAADFIGSPADRTGLGGLEAIDEIRLVVCPDVMAGYDGTNEAKERVKMVQEAMISHCERMRYRFAVLDTPPGLSAQQAFEWRNYINFDTSYAALYYPWIKVADLSGGGSTTKLVPSSGHMVGIYNRSDARVGVHKAPANEIIMGAIDLEFRLSKGEQDVPTRLGSTAFAPSLAAASVFGAPAPSAAMAPGATSASAVCSSWWKPQWKLALPGWSSNPTTAACGPKSRGMSPHSCGSSGVAALCLGKPPIRLSMSNAMKN